MINKIEDLSICIASVIGLAQIQTILGIIILCFQLVLILYKMCKKIIDKLKKKDYTINEDIEQGIKELEEYQKYLESKEEKSNDK